MKKKNILVIFLTLVFSVLTATAILSGTAGAKSLYLVPDHNNMQFDAWNINPGGAVTYQASYGLSWATDPAGMAIDESSNTLFITTEYSASSTTFEIVDANTMTIIGYTNDGDDFGGIAVDDQNNIIYAIKRMNTDLDDLYAYDWDPSLSTATLRAGFPIDLPNLNQAMGAAIDEAMGILWVADSGAGVARAYDIATWTEDASKSFTPIHKPVAIAVDSVRGCVYTTSMDAGAWTPSGCGSHNLSKYDLSTSTETVGDLIDQGVGIAVDEVTGYAYVTISPYDHADGLGYIQAWDTSTFPFIEVESEPVSGSPAGICIPREEVSFNPLNLMKDDRLELCVNPGNEINYSICFDNMNDFSANNVILEDTLPSELIFVDASDGGSYDSVNHTVVWDVGTISIEEGGCGWLLVQVDLSTPPGTAITNYVTIDSDETPSTTVSEETLVCRDSGEDYPPIQTIELGTPLMEDVYNTSLEWLDLIGSQTPVWINSSDAETGTDFIKYKLFKSDVFGNWDDPAWVYVYDNQQTGDPFTTDADLNDGRISIQFYIEESCFHQIHAHCVDTVGNWNFSEPFDFLVDFDAPSNDDFTYIDDYLLPGGARFINNHTIKRIFANDTGCTGGVAGVDRIIWRIENNKTQIIAEGIIYDNNDTGYEDANVNVSGDLDDTEGKMIIDIQLNEECMHFIYHQAIDKLENNIVGRKQLVYVDLTPPTIFKTVGDPNCTIVTGEEYCITPETPITFYAEDRGCMGGVGLDTIEYNIWYKGEWKGWMLLEDLQNESLYLTEECMHYLLIRATDILGNEFEDNETFYVDITAPIIEKTVGDPNCTLNCKSLKLPSSNVTMVVQHLGANSYFDVTLSVVPFGYDISNGDYLGWCVDQNQFISNGVDYSVDLWCSYDPLMPWPDPDWDMVNYIINHKHPEATSMDIQEAIWYFVDGGNDPSTDIGLSMVENATNFGEGFMPAIGEWCAILCDAGEDAQKTFIEVLVPDRYCVTTDTNITLDAVDLGCCPSGDFTIEYRIWYLGTWTSWMNYTGNITLSGECVHYLEARAYDCLGNLGEIDNETFYVDETPPEIIKTVGDPNCTGCGEMGDDDYCVTTDTFITLDALEMGCCPSEGVTIEYKIGDGSWIEYVEPFNFTEECEHQLYVRAYDCLDNGMDEMYWDNETFYVDETPPEIIKIVGEPNCTDCGEMGEDDYCVTTETLITLDTLEMGCCPCENVTIDYMIGWNAEGWSWTDWIRYTEPFNFTEECEHQLVVRAYDCLGNGLDDSFWDYETFYVDDTPPPKPEKIVGEPKVRLENDSSGHDQWMIFPDTEICFTGIGDEGCCPCEEVTIEYRVWYLGSWTEWTDYTECITLTRGCVHYLEARAYDCLGNRGEIDNETFWVCSPGDTGPTVMINDPMFGSTHCERTLKVNITAFDHESPWDELIVKLWIPGGRRDAPTLWYDPEYNETDGYWYADIDIFKYQDGAEITLQALAVDGNMNSEFAIPVTFEICSNTVWDQWMQNGWSKLTIPFGGISCSNSVENVLASIDGMYSKIYYYDVVEDTWHSWIKELVEMGFVDLEDMYCGKDYWVKMNNTEARFYTDTGEPEVEILDPIDGEVRCEGPGNMNFYAYDYETGVDEVHVLIHDITADTYWNGSTWLSEETWLLCAHDYDEYWEYDSEGIWTLDHSYNITAKATDMAGCSAFDMISFEIEEACICAPSIDLEKQVWDGEGWSNVTDIFVGQNATFNLSIHNDGEIIGNGNGGGELPINETILAVIEDGIAWLVTQQNPDGSWGASDEEARTGFVLIKLQDYAYETGYSPFDPSYEYSTNVIEGWEYLFENCLSESLPVQTNGDPDTNGNGYGLYWNDGSHEVYSTGICAMALSASGTPDRENDGGIDFNSDGDPDTFGEISQDVVDWLAYAQSDSGVARGGWYYSALDNTGNGDNSITGYAVLGLASAEGFGSTVPNFVRTEHNLFINYIQCDTPGDTFGGSGYTSGCYWVNLLKTGNLIFEMTFYGDSPGDTRFANAMDYIENHWHDQNYAPGWGYNQGSPSHYQAIFCLMKGLEYSGIDLIDLDGDDIPEHDWYSEFADVLVSQQDPSGYWPTSPAYVWDDGGWGTMSGELLSTVWVLLTLEKIAPQIVTDCPPCNLTDGYLNDTLPAGLEYIENSTKIIIITCDGVFESSGPEVQPKITYNPDGTTTLEWWESDEEPIDITLCTTIYLYFNATVLDCEAPDGHINMAYVTAYSPDDDSWVSDEDTATVWGVCEEPE